MPGTLSHKHRPPTAVEAIRTDFERRLAVADVVGELPELPRPVRTPAMPHPARADDPLLRIAPEVYVARLLGVEIPRHRKVRCPFHADRTASLHVYETAARGWYCFGHCRRGGTIYDLAAPLYGYDPAARTSSDSAPTSAGSSASRRSMTDVARWHEFAYEQTDIPAGDRRSATGAHSAPPRRSRALVAGSSAAPRSAQRHAGERCAV